MRLIDADAFAQKMKEHHDFYIEAWGGFNKLPPDTKARVDEISACWAEVYNASTVDAVEVVRCGNCKHFREPFCCRRDDETHRERINMLTVDFCSYGERKDNGE